MQRTKTAIIGTIIGEFIFVAILGIVLYFSFPYVHSYLMNPENKTDAFVIVVVLIISTFVFLYHTMNRIIFRVKILLRKTNPLTNK
ncbi:MAG: hypothetical protein WC242_04300 [Candidatus Paceibacterota bacterium]